MAHKKNKPAHRATREPQPVAGMYPISTGEAELIPDSYRDGGWLLLINGVHSSHIVLGKPRELDFEYMRWVAAITESHVAEHLDANKLRITHLGGGAASLARYFASVYPHSRNTVVELDDRLAAYVREWFDIPAAPRVKIRVGEAGEVTRSFAPASRDVVIRDVFAGTRTPTALAGVDFVRAVDAALAPGGLYVLNCGDTPDLASARAEVAALTRVFEHVGLIADSAMFKGRRRGNMVMAASHAPLPEAGTGRAAALAKVLLGGGLPAQYRDTAAARRFARLTP